MSHTQLPVYAPLAEFLFDAGAYPEACELHGLLCGFICGGLIAPNTAWMNLLLHSAHESVRPQLTECVNTLFRISLEQLSSFGFDFEILLPEAEPQQNLLLISKLSQWCEAFLLGLEIAQSGSRAQRTGAGKISIDKEAKKDLQEAKDDIENVSRIYNQVLQCNEPFDEEAFSSVLEHVRVATMLIFTELNGRVRPTQH